MDSPKSDKYKLRYPGSYTVEYADNEQFAFRITICTDSNNKQTIITNSTRITNIVFIIWVQESNNKQYSNKEQYLYNEHKAKAYEHSTR